MIFYDGIYRLRQKGGGGTGNGRENGSAWRVRIINFSATNQDVTHLRPIFIVATPTEDLLFKSSCAETLGHRICQDFNLQVSQIVWIEYFPDRPQKMSVAIFTPKFNFGPQTFYTIRWRPVRPNELQAIKPFIAEAEAIDKYLPEPNHR